MKILLCFGTRPEAIKMAPVIHELKRQRLEYIVCVTAQHREMLDQALDFFEISPDYDLNLMRPGQSLNHLSANVLRFFDQVLEKEKPGVVLVHGDTTTSAMAAWAAFHRGIKVGHVEAGLRTYNRAAPFPEEVNRQITARLSDFHFAPTEQAKKNLLSEGIIEEGIHLTGNTIVDAIYWSLPKLNSLDFSEMNFLRNLLEKEKKFILVTGHRRENFGKGLQEVCEALVEITEKEEVEIIFPVHLNPNVQKAIQQLLENYDSIHLIDPVSYPVMLWLMKKASLIITDSGGIQEEAPTFGVPVIVTRESSERMEGVNSGFSILTGAKKQRIVEESLMILQNSSNLKSRQNPFGDGTAAVKIVDFLKTLKVR